MDENIWKSFNYLLIKENFTIFSGVQSAFLQSIFISQKDLAYKIKKALGFSLADRQIPQSLFLYFYILLSKRQDSSI